jgi:hypothetical protein
MLRRELGDYIWKRLEDGHLMNYLERLQDIREIADSLKPQTPLPGVRCGQEGRRMW